MTDTDPRNVITDLLGVGARVHDHIAELVDAQTGQWSAGDGDPSVIEALGTYRDMALNGGKRLRPAFAYWAYEGVGGDPDDRVILNAAVAVELLHTFALIHDDVMDQADTRRGAKTIHIRYAQRHQELALRGDGDHYGESIAILMGDLAFAHAALLMTRVPAPCAEIFFGMCADLMVGQYLDIESSAVGPVPGRSVAGQITELKTARYTVEGPLLLGAAAAGRADDLRDHFIAYGRPLGHAFQLRDDLLGTFGDSEATGKPVGDDLAQGKVTMLLEVGLAKTDQVHHELLTRLGTPAMEPGDVERAQQLLIECGARDAVETAIVQSVDEACAAVSKAPLTAEIRGLLVDAAHLIANRDH